MKKLLGIFAFALVFTACPSAEDVEDAATTPVEDGSVVEDAMVVEDGAVEMDVVVVDTSVFEDSMTFEDVSPED